MMKHLLGAVVSVCAFTVHAELPALIPREILLAVTTKGIPSDLIKKCGTPFQVCR